jgi:polyhydroxyalkanoate synthesis regulator phasin
MWNFLKKLKNLFTKKQSVSAPLLIIKKTADDANVKEYNSIEEAITDIEKDPNVPTEKIEKLKSSVRLLKDKTCIKIRNGEIIK